MDGAKPGEYTRRVREELQTRCVHLYTKEGFLGLPEEHEQEFEADGPVWWCDQTGNGLGPDGSIACQEACCRFGRACYEPPASISS